MARPLHPGHDTRPVSANGFFGRDRDLAALTALVAAHPVVTVAGSGGAGKTRLVREFAAGARGPVWFAELADVTDPEAVAGAIAATAGVVRASPFHGHLAVALADAAGLLVVDNCEHLIERCAQLISELAERCHGLRIIATSREPLNIPPEAVLRLGPLSVPGSDALAELALSPAVAMFVERARHRDRDFAVPSECLSWAPNLPIARPEQDRPSG